MPFVKIAVLGTLGGAAAWVVADPHHVDTGLLGACLLGGWAISAVAGVVHHRLKRHSA
ncbi:hypothetical protein ACLB1G_18210 [Oxalobacteraceae bacterium A2-2]